MPLIRAARETKVLIYCHSHFINVFPAFSKAAVAVAACSGGHGRPCYASTGVLTEGCK